MRPRSLSSLPASRSSEAVLARRPTATSTFSASKLTSLPSLFLQTTFAPTEDLSTRCTGHSRLNSMPIFFMCATPILVRSPSSIGSMWSSASTTVIFVPNAAYAQASSRPMTPAPMTTIDFGSFSSESAPVESMQLGFSLRPGIGGMAFTEPVATIIASAVISSVEPSVFLTESLPGATNFASPSTLVTLFILNRPAMPLVSCLLMSFLCLMTCGKSTSTPLTLTPISAPCSSMSLIPSALCSRHLVGMQPMLRQVPPRCSRSTTVTFAPSCAARIAAT